MGVKLGHYSNPNKINFLLSREKNQDESPGLARMKIQESEKKKKNDELKQLYQRRDWGN